MTPQEKIKELAELDGWIQDEHYTTIFRKEFSDRIRECSIKSQTLNYYLESYDAIIPLIQKTELYDEVMDVLEMDFEITRTLSASPIQLSDALLIATGRMR